MLGKMQHKSRGQGRDSAGGLPSSTLIVRETWMLEPRFEESQQVGYVDVWEKSILARGSNL